jgi:hypothetical protein
VGQMATGVGRRHVLLVRSGNRGRGRGCWCIRLDGRHLSLGSGAWVEVVRNRRPSLAQAGRIHSRYHCHDVHVRVHGQKTVTITCCDSNMKGRLRVHGLRVLSGRGEVASLVQDVVMAAVKVRGEEE